MLISLLLFICELIFGILIFDFFDPEKKFNIWEKLLFSSIIGFLLSNFAILIFALLSKSLLISIIVFFLLFFSFLYTKKLKALLFLNEIKEKLVNYKWNLKDNFTTFLLLIIGAPYFYYLWNIMFTDENGAIKAFLSGWGDNGFHISLIQRFANASPFNLDNPLLSGAKITYHFLFDFSSAIFYFLNKDLLFSYRIPLLLFGVISFCTLFMLVLRLSKSKILALTAIALIFLGSGLGFLVALSDIKTAFTTNGFDGIFSFLNNAPHEYTSIKFDAGISGRVGMLKNINWLVPVVSFLSHQRAFLLGFSCFVLLLTAIIIYGNSKEFWRFGLIAGLLPLAHVHTFFAIFLIMATLFWFYLKNWKSWIKFALLTALISVPQIIYLKASNNSENNFFLKPFFGWMACSHNVSWFFCDQNTYHDNVLFFWFKNFGFIFLAWTLIFILIFALKLFKNKLLANINLDIKFIAASAVLFIVPNLFLFQPWNYDNNKVIFYWQFLAVVFCLIPFLQFIYQKNAILKASVIIFVFLTIFSGLLDFSIKVMTVETNSYGYSDGSKDNQKMAQWIKNNTLPNSLFLTSSWVDPVPVFLAGRKIYLGYPGWLWTEGLDYYKNQANGEEILAGNMQLACDEKIDYILFDKALKDSYNTINEKYVLDNTTTVYSQTTSFETKKILKLKCD